MESSESDLFQSMSLREETVRGDPGSQTGNVPCGPHVTLSIFLDQGLGRPLTSVWD